MARSADIEDFVGDDETLADLVAQAGGSVTDSIFATTLMILALAGLPELGPPALAV